MTGGSEGQPHPPIEDAVEQLIGAPEITVDDWFKETKADLRKFAAELALADDVPAAIALLQAEQAIVHAENVCSEYGVDGSTPFHQAARD